MVMNAYLRTIRLKRMGFYVRNKIKCAVIHLHNSKLVAMKTYSEFGDSCENIKKKEIVLCNIKTLLKDQ